MIGAIKIFLGYALGAICGTILGAIVLRALGLGLIKPYIALPLVFLTVLVTVMTVIIRVWRDFSADFIHTRSAIVCGLLYGLFFAVAPWIFTLVLRDGIIQGNDGLFLAFCGVVLLAFPILCGAYLYYRCYRVGPTGFCVVSKSEDQHDRSPNSATMPLDE